MRDFTLQKVAIILLIGIGALFAVNKAMQPDAGLMKFKVSGDVAYGYGTTKSRSLSDFRAFLRDNPQVRTLVLRNMPGTQDGTTNTKIARLIRKEGLNTRLESNSFIASGAVDLFLAGNQRTMACGALIGVHSWAYYGDDNGIVRGPSFHPANMGSDPYQKDHEKFLSDMGIDPAFYAFTRDAALPEDLHFLTGEEIARFRLLTAPANCG